MSWLLPCCLSPPPLTMGVWLGEVWLSGRGASCSPSLLLLSSPLPEALAESDELLLPLLLICSITSTSARSSVHSNRKSARLMFTSLIYHTSIQHFHQSSQSITAVGCQRSYVFEDSSSIRFKHDRVVACYICVNTLCLIEPESDYKLPHLF